MEDINKMTIEEAKKELEFSKERVEVLSSLFNGPTTSSRTDTQDDHWEIGEQYLIRTVTHIDIGVLLKVTDKELVLVNCFWIADTGRFHDCLKSGIDDLDKAEYESFPPEDKVTLGRGAIVDAVRYHHKLGKSQK